MQALNNIDDLNILAIIRLIHGKGLNNSSFFHLLNEYGSPSNILNNIAKINNSHILRKKICLQSESYAKDEIKKANDKNITIIPFYASEYPILLKGIIDKPPIIYALGRLSLLKKVSVGVIGSRNSTINGYNAIYNLSKSLGESGLCIVSGFAKGIDRAAHIGAMKTGTVAVLGCGVDVTYPLHNSDIYQDIVDNGIFISEFPIGSQPKAYHFPRRNRIISGISRGIIVGEANINSGSLITANIALKQGKDIFALPGNNHDALSKGPNYLIKNGAYLVENEEDVLNVVLNNTIMEDSIKDNNKIENIESKYSDICDVDNDSINEISAAINQIIGYDPVNVDEIINSINADTKLILQVMVIMELNDKITWYANNSISKYIEVSQ